MENEKIDEINRGLGVIKGMLGLMYAALSNKEKLEIVGPLDQEGIDWILYETMERADKVHKLINEVIKEANA